jgi:hypothetical protein
MKIRIPLHITPENPSIAHQATPPSKKRGRVTGHVVSDKTFILLSALTVAGFAIAVLANLRFPQIASVEISSYAVIGGVALDINGAYRIALAGLFLLYLCIAVFSWFDPDRR